MDTKEILIFLVIGCGWVAFVMVAFKFINKFLLKNKNSLTFGNLIVDLIFLCLGFYSFYGNKYWQGIYAELNGQIIVIIILNLIYFGCLGIFGYAGVHQHIRYGVATLILWMGISLGVVLLILDKSQLPSLFNQLWAGYTWYMMILFPMEIGNIIRKLELYIKLRKNRNS